MYPQNCNRRNENTFKNKKWWINKSPKHIYFNPHFNPFPFPDTITDTLCFVKVKIIDALQNISAKHTQFVFPFFHLVFIFDQNIKWTPNIAKCYLAFFEFFFVATPNDIFSNFKKFWTHNYSWWTLNHSSYRKLPPPRSVVESYSGPSLASILIPRNCKIRVNFVHFFFH